MNKTTHAVTAMIVCFGLLLASCGTSPPVRYFSLEPIHQAVNQGDEDRPIVGLGQLRVPNYVFRSHMVTRSRGGELIVHDYRRWSEPLDQAIHRVVAANLDSLVNEMTVVAFPYNTMVTPAYRVHGSVERFDINTVGQAVLIVQWGIAGEDGTTVSATRRSRYEARAAGADDPAAVVNALNEVLAAYSEDLAERLGSTLP